MVYDQLIDNWDEISRFLTRPKNDEDLDKLVDLADYLMDTLVTNPNLEGLLDTVGTLIADYEKKNVPEPDKPDAISMLKYFMRENGLKQKDLIEIGSPGVISEVFNGKRELNKRQIAALSKRFKCSPALFF